MTPKEVYRLSIYLTRNIIKSPFSRQLDAFLEVQGCIHRWRTISPSCVTCYKSMVRHLNPRVFWTPLIWHLNPLEIVCSGQGCESNLQSANRASPIHTYAECRGGSLSRDNDGSHGPFHAFEWVSMERCNGALYLRLAGKTKRRHCILWVIRYHLLLRIFGLTADHVSFKMIGMGWMGTYHFIDPTTGVAGVFGTQVLPTLEHEELSLYAEFERTLYASLSS